METLDEMLLATWVKLHSSVPSSYVQPPETRPGSLIISSGNTIPVIDLGGGHDHHDHDHDDIIKQILKASEDYGFFQVINHGVSTDLMDDVLNIFKEFHAMPTKEKVNECSKDPDRSCKVYTSGENHSRDAVRYWKDTLTHPCPPSGEYMEYWPQKPSEYREVVGNYTRELRKLGLKILELLCEGLGLNPGYFCGGLSENASVVVNHYPPCPDPSLTLGLAKHRDPSILTILLQEIHGLQVLKDGQWFGVEPIPHAFVVNIGLLLQVVNHGVSMELIEDTLNIFKEFHAMPAEEKISESSKDPNGSCKLYASREINSKDAIQFWRDTLRHLCPPSGEFMEFWPRKPARYREVVEKYTRELRKLGLKILELLCEGVGLDPEYCSGLCESPLLLTHYYPPCPEPSLTLGAPKHRDPTLATILLQEKDINALQVFKDGEWIGVEPIPNAFVVNIGLLLQIISNGRLRGAEHRVVTNSGTPRTTVAYFIRPTNETIIEPAKPLTSSADARPIYRSITFEEFSRIFMSKGPDIEPELLF